MRLPIHPFAFAISSIFSIWSLSSCVSTDTVTPGDNSAQESRLVLNLSSSDEATRASAGHEGYKLRYIAKLYQGSSNNLNENTLQRKELLDGDKDEGTINQIIFYVDPNKTYNIFVYADYIPESAVKNAEGEYGDFYYDTHSSKDQISMLASSKGTREDLGKDFFNNDNYDLFSTSIQIEKKTQREERDLVLNRSVAKVRFIDETDNSGNYDVSVTYLNHSSKLSLFDGSTNPTTTVYHDSEVKVSDSKSITSANEKEVLFFYVFAKASAGSSTIDATLTLNGAGGDSKVVKATNIPVRQNYITTVKGEFLPSATGGNTPGQGGNDNPGTEDPGQGDEPDPDQPELREDGIYLNLSVTTDQWENQSTAWSE